MGGGGIKEEPVSGTRSGAAVLPVQCVPQAESQLHAYTVALMIARVDYQIEYLVCQNCRMIPDHTILGPRANRTVTVSHAPTRLCGQEPFGRLGSLYIYQSATYWLYYPAESFSCFLTLSLAT